MKHASIPVALFVLLFVGVEGAIASPSAQAAPVVSTTVSKALVPFTGTVTALSQPKSAGLALDFKPNTFRYSPTGIQFFSSTGGMTIGLANSLIASTLKNSTHIQYSFSSAGITVNYFVKNDTNKHDRRISISGTATGPQILSIPLTNPNAFPVSVCDINNLPAVCTRVCFGVMCFDWADMPGASYNNVTQVLTKGVIGSFLFDPIAMDTSGSASCNSATSCSAPSEAPSANDILYVVCWNIAALDTITISDNRVSHLNWITRKALSDVNQPTTTAFYAVDSAGGSIVVKCSYVIGGNLGVAIVGVKGADTATVFDTNAAVPCSNKAATGTTQSCSISTNNANDMILGAFGVGGGVTVSAGTGFLIQTQARAGIEYDVVSTTQSGLSVAISWTGSNPNSIIGDAIRQAPAAAAPSGFPWFILAPLFIGLAWIVMRRRK